MCIWKIVISGKIKSLSSKSNCIKFEVLSYYSNYMCKTHWISYNHNLFNCIFYFTGFILIECFFIWKCFPYIILSIYNSRTVWLKCCAEFQILLGIPGSVSGTNNFSVMWLCWVSQLFVDHTPLINWRTPYPVLCCVWRTVSCWITIKPLGYIPTPVTKIPLKTISRQMASGYLKKIDLIVKFL